MALQELVWEPYDFTALAVYSRRSIPLTTGSDRHRAQPPALAAGRSGDRRRGGANSHGLRKVVVTGDDLATLRPLLDQATQITLWKSGDTEYNLWFRPLLPDEVAAL